MPKRAETNNVPANKVEEVITSYKDLDGADDVVKIKESDGEYTVIAFFHDKKKDGE